MEGNRKVKNGMEEVRKGYDGGGERLPSRASAGPLPLIKGDSYKVEVRCRNAGTAKL